MTTITERGRQNDQTGAYVRTYERNPDGSSSETFIQMVKVWQMENNAETRPGQMLMETLVHGFAFMS